MRSSKGLVLSHQQSKTQNIFYSLGLQLNIIFIVNQSSLLITFCINGSVVWSIKCVTSSFLICHRGGKKAEKFISLFFWQILQCESQLVELLFLHHNFHSHWKKCLGSWWSDICAAHILTLARKLQLLWFGCCTYTYFYIVNISINGAAVLQICQLSDWLFATVFQLHK